MKILNIILGLLLITNSVFAESGKFKPGSEPDGFRDIKWGTDFSTLSDMIPNPKRIPLEYGGAGTVRTYLRKGDKLTIGEVNLEEIEYWFWNNKFYRVIITVREYANYKALKDIAIEKFGIGEETTMFEGYWISVSWEGPKTAIALQYMSGVNSSANEITPFMMMTSVELDKKFNEELARESKQKAKEGAKDF